MSSAHFLHAALIGFALGRFALCSSSLEEVMPPSYPTRDSSAAETEA